MVDTKNIKISEIEINKGQIDGLPKNPRFIKDDKFNKLVKSIEENPEMLGYRELLVYPHDGKYVVIGGNMRLRACKELGYKEIPCKVLPQETTIEQLKAYTIKDNNGYGAWDYDLLANEWDAVQLDDWGLDLQFIEETEVEAEEQTAVNDKGSLSDRFIVPPFTILNSRAGEWQNRKKLWRAKIGDLGMSRECTLRNDLMNRYPSDYEKYNKDRRGLTFREYLESVGAFEREQDVTSVGVSLFDPVLAEICCKWFCPEGGSIVDCFAGDTQKGLVFAECGHPFTGVELRPEQVAVNESVIEGRCLPIKYICDDGRNVAKHVAPNSQDMLFSCPPYYDLEVYSDNENDASNQGTYDEFFKILDDAFTSAIGCLKENRFAVLVVGDVINKKTGAYYDFVSDCKRLFMSRGLHLLNELILVESCGSAAIISGKQMEHRKVVKTHQNVLVFYKGDPRKIKEHFQPITYTNEDIALFGCVDEDD